MQLFLTLILALVIFVGLFAMFLGNKEPVYRLQRENLICLFEMLLKGEASEDDWNVFIEMPIRHDESLEEIRAFCIEITGEKIKPGIDGLTLTEAGRVEIERLLVSLKSSS